MHELGVVIEVVETVEKFAADNQVEKIEALVLQIGELSSMIPQYIKAVFPAAADGTLLQDTELLIEVIPGNALCRECNKVFNVMAGKGACPLCGGRSMELLSGKEFNIKEIHCY